MRKDLDRLIKEYYEQYDDEIDFDYFRKVCRWPFIWLVNKVKSPDMTDVRLMYLGTFVVKRWKLPSYIKTLIKYGQIDHAKQLIEQLDETQKKRECIEDLSRAKNTGDQK